MPLEAGSPGGGDLSLASVLTPSRDLRAVEAALDRLPVAYREAVVLRRIAEALGRSEGGARNLVCRGLARLSGPLEP